MSEPPSEQPQSQPRPEPRTRRGKRPLVFALAGVVLIAATAILTRPKEHDEEGDSAASKNKQVYPIKRRPAPPTLGLEYHFDRNAFADTRILSRHIVGLVAAGNLLAFDKNTFALSKERVLRRRATCLGPSDGDSVLAGISNGAIVRVHGDDLAFDPVTRVPGKPVWIGKRGQATVIAYEPEPGADVLVRDDGNEGRTYAIGPTPVLFLDSQERLWSFSEGRVERIALATGKREEVPVKGGWANVRGFVELSSGQVWAMGGGATRDMPASFVAKVWPGPPATLLYARGQDVRENAAPRPATPITHIVETRDPQRLFVVSGQGIVASDPTLTRWTPTDATLADPLNGETFVAKGQAHESDGRLVLALDRGGLFEFTSEIVRRHRVEGQNTVSRLQDIVRLGQGVAFYGEGGPLYYVEGAWRALPDAIIPPHELMGPSRPGIRDRQWAAVRTIPIEGNTHYVVTKAGVPRSVSGDPRGLRDTVLTAVWDGEVLAVRGREELPIEPEDCFVTPDRELWNIDDQGLWSFLGGRWRLTIRSIAWKASVSKRHPVNKTAAQAEQAGLPFGPGRRLHFFGATGLPFYGLPSGTSSYALIRLDSNEAGGVPLIDEIPVKVGGRRLLLHDLAQFGREKDELLLATDHGLCAFNLNYGNYEFLRPEGLDGEVRIFMRDGTKRLWMSGDGLWVLRDSTHADPVHPSIPMLSDTRVTALAQAPDGRIVVGTEDRGVVFVTIPQGGLPRQSESYSFDEEWEKTAAHEAVFLDPGVVLRACGDNADRVSDAALGEWVAKLRKLVAPLGPRARVTTEPVFEGKPDIVARGAEPDRLMETIVPALAQVSNKVAFSVHKRFGPPGSAMIEAKPCP